MKNSFTYYHVQSKLGDAQPAIVGHSTNKETKEIYYKFVDRKKAVILMEDEKKAKPEYQYRIVKHTKIIEIENWS